MKKTFFVALALLGAGVALKPSSNVNASTIDVKHGDTLWGYSKKYHVSISDIAKANHFDVNKYMMWPGDEINIPDGKEMTGSFKNHFVSSPTKVAPIEKVTAVAKTVKRTVSAPVKSTPVHKAVTTTKSAGMFKITFYDPAVLGASTMPGGMYSGVAANLSVFPKGTRLKIVMSNGQTLYRTVNDTGAFAASNSHQLDVAMPNSQVPAAGVLSATVTVL